MKKVLLVSLSMMVLFITTIDANGCVNIPAKIIGTVKLVLLLEKSAYSANINLY